MRYVVDRARSDVSFQASHLMFSSVAGKFAEFSGEVHLEPTAPPDLPQLMEDGGFVEIIVASLDAGMGQTANDRALCAMEAGQFPVMKCVVAGPWALSSNSSGHTTVLGRVLIRDVELDVHFQVAADPRPSADRDEVTLRATAELDRFAFGVCPSWPSVSLGRTVTLQAVLVATPEREEPPDGPTGKAS
eukprot:CAMPEP_0175495028 /NCGR_PEP_ID=MMETSP0096-20121207/3585_1 /TAXON_ID=311494 /ORGANISM="Alexandrium monilatum, Strain CCMP3105" /LENGTH=188 /DNA_ID=CAMNT_0016797007 /DNA_START=57 /DNA_END=623 /DNA_ORIENTATION=+